MRDCHSSVELHTRGVLRKKEHGDTAGRGDAAERRHTSELRNNAERGDTAK